MYQTILVPVTEAPESKVAARRARELATCFDATVTFLHVIPADGYKFGVETTTNLDNAERLLDELIAETFVDSSVEARRTVRHGDRRETTLQYLDEIDADLVIFGRTEAKKMRDYLPWKELPHIVRKSDVSVLLAHPESDDPN
jgi:nucleotide-binding universal stress UspA family protein